MLAGAVQDWKKKPDCLRVVFLLFNCIGIYDVL